MSPNSRSLSPGHPPIPGGIYARRKERPKRLEVHSFRNAVRPLDGRVVLTRIGQPVHSPFRWISWNAGGCDPWHRSSERYLTRGVVRRATRMTRGGRPGLNGLELVDMERVRGYHFCKYRLSTNAGCPRFRSLVPGSWGGGFFLWSFRCRRDSNASMARAIFTLLHSVVTSGCLF
jgi:hypothetical protein